MPAESFGIHNLISVLGIGVIIGIAWLFSKDRSAVNWRIVKWGLGLQFFFAILILGTGLGDAFFSGVDAAFTRLMSFAEEGMDFVFQPVAPFFKENVGTFEADGALVWSEQTFPRGRMDADLMGRAAPSMKTFAFWVLPTIIFFSALMSVLYHVGIMGVVVNFFGRLMHKTMGTSGAESMSAASNIFVGQTEAPLVVKPFVDDMTKSELHAVMTGGFATIAGGVMAMYVLFLNDIPGIAGHLVVASVLSAPAALAIAKILYPEDGEPVTGGGAQINVEKTSQNVIEAAARGSTQGLQLALNVAAMLIAFIALVAMVDWVLSTAPVYFCDGSPGLGYNEACDPLSLSNGLGMLFSPLAWSMGVPWEDAPTVGALLGEKMVLTELYAYQHFGELQADPATAISERSAIITSYALCGFANFASIGIQIGGLGAIAPDRLRDIAAVGFRAMIGGTLAAMMTGTVAGVLLG